MSGLEFGLSILAAITITVICTLAAYSRATNGKIAAFKEAIALQNVAFTTKIAEMQAEFNLNLQAIQKDLEFAGKRLTEINNNLNNGWKCSSHLQIEKDLVRLKDETKNNIDDITELKKRS